MVRYISPFYRFIGTLLMVLLFPTFGVAQQCPVPLPGETIKEIPSDDQEDIPRGTCAWVDIGGKLRYETVSLSLDQTTGSGFHFNQDNGPTSIQTNDNKVLICSDSASCGSTAIVIESNGVATEIGYVRSDNGRWVFAERLSECPFSGPPTVRVQNWSSYYDDLIMGKHKIYEDKSMLYGCSAVIGSTCDCDLCYKKLTCIDYPDCPAGFTRPSKDDPCCKRISYSGTTQIITIYCTKMGNGPWLYEWRCP